MILGKKNIQCRLATETLKFDGALRRGSFLLTLGTVAQRFNPATKFVDPLNRDSLEKYYEELEAIAPYLSVASGESVLVATSEQISLPDDLTGLISTLSHVARFNLTTQPTSFIVDPGFNGYLTLELYNYGTATLQLTTGMPLAKVLLLATESTPQEINSPNRFYGTMTGLASRYDYEFGD